MSAITHTDPLSIEINPSWLIDPKAPLQWIYYNGTLVKKPLKTGWQNEEEIIRLPKNCILENPLYLIHIVEANEKPGMIPLKNIILAEENATATLIEVYLSIGDEPSVSEVNTDIKLEKGARVTHVFVQRSTSNSIQNATINIQQSEKSHYRGNAIQAGGNVNRTNCKIELHEPHATCEFYTMLIAKKNQRMDLELALHHYAPNTVSKTISRAIIKDKAKSTFTGEIYVPKNAAKTKALLENKNLLLSPSAEANTRPRLYIDTNDVECTHGATVGNLDLEALFYLRSRGLTKEVAKQFLIRSFLEPSLQGLPLCTLAYLEVLFHEF